MQKEIRTFFVPKFCFLPVKKYSFRVLLSFCLIFCQFQPGAAYKSVAYTKKASILVDKYGSFQSRLCYSLLTKAVSRSCSVKKVFLKTFFLPWNLFFDKVAGLIYGIGKKPEIKHSLVNVTRQIHEGVY